MSRGGATVFGIAWLVLAILGLTAGDDTTFIVGMVCSQLWCAASWLDRSK